MRLSRALSLLETVVAIFLLVGVLVVFARLIHTMLIYGVLAEQRSVASLAAQQKLEEIRDWANQGANFQGNWSTYDGQISTNPSFPGITLTCSVEDHVLSSPCTELESKASRPRQIVRSCKKVQVVARWSQDRGNFLRLVTLMGAPPREPNLALSVTSAIPDPLAALASGTASVTATDTTGQPLYDLFYTWSTLPTGIDPGNGTATALDANANTAELRNQVLMPPAPPQVVSGTCSLGVTAVYRGRLLEGGTNAVNLLP